MTVTQRFLFGGLGSVLPILLNLLAVDAKTMFTDFVPAVFAGYVVRCAILFALGGAVILVFHADETRISKIVQLGMVAPALITQMLNAGNAAPQSASISGQFMTGMVSVAYAGEPEQTKNEGHETCCPKVRDFAEEEQKLNTFISGLTGDRNIKTFYVMSGIPRTDLRNAVDDAAQTVVTLREKKLLRTEENKNEELRAEVFVYLPYKVLKGFSVVLSQGMEKKQAEQLMDILKRNGFKDTYIFDLSCGCFPDEKGE